MAIEDGKAILSFTHGDGGLTARNGPPLKGFAIAGEDRKFVWANAEIRGEKVFVQSPGVPKPVAVRYAWADTPDCDLCNKAALPASPFRTDSWVADEVATAPSPAASPLKPHLKASPQSANRRLDP
jgi:sialate O-acetylesterase